MGIQAYYKNALGYREIYPNAMPQTKPQNSTGVSTGTETPTTGVDTSGAGTATGGATGTPPVTTYAQTLKDLEAMRSGAVKGAEAQYQRAQASYGSLGASLAQAGLANSGYAAALDSAAYASLARSKDAAQTAYGQGVVAADYARQTSYADTLAKLMGGEYSAEQAKAIGQSYGYTGAQMQGITDEVRSQITAQIKADPSANTLAYYDELAAKGTITPEEAAAYRAEQNRSVFDQINRITQSGNVDNINAAATDLDNLYKNGNIDEPTYNDAKTLLVPALLTAKFSSGAITAKEYVDGMVLDNSATVKADFVTSGTGRSGLKSSKDAMDKDDIDIYLPNGEKFDLRTKGTTSVGQISMPLRKQLNKLYDGSPSHNKIALYNGKLYAFNGGSGDWYELEGDVDEIDKAIAAILKYQQSKS